jgi:hypothetical protein
VRPIPRKPTTTRGREKRPRGKKAQIIVILGLLYVSAEGSWKTRKDDGVGVSLCLCDSLEMQIPRPNKWKKTTRGDLY